MLLSAASDTAAAPAPALSAAEAAAWRARHAQLSPGRLLLWQCLVAVAVAVLALLWTQSVPALYSAASGAAAVLLPAAGFAHALRRPLPDAHAMLLRFFAWQLVKLMLSATLLLAAALLLPELHWPALLVALVLTSKTQWIALLMPGKWA